ncbi:CDP-diacylglycerol-inositol 3-phosphatidyltransferase [Nowakowskiella sp. JEL0407]|nr:CDP-diacylglycerol-inositol 3-phosphatidyltransferase [Nowakowskiella sp. JEL0407]
MAINQVFLYVPNLIGYSRVLLGIVAMYLLPTNPIIAMSFYTVSAVLDAIDGMAARHFDQATQFGTVLDMVTDRSTTSCLLVYLAVQYPTYALAFQLLIALDLSSHYMHMYMTLTQGAKSHKSMTEKDNWLLRLYYTNTKVLFLVCFGDQLFFITLYLLQWLKSNGSGSGWEVYLLHEIVGLVKGSFWISLPVCVFKQILNVVQLVRASKGLAADDALKQKNKTRSD